MNKEELSKKIAGNSGLTIVNSRKFIESFTNVMTEELINDNKITIHDFGSWEVTKRKPRVVKEFVTGINKTVQPRNVVKFNTSKLLKRLINE